MKIVYDNLIDTKTGKHVVVHLPKGIDRRKFKRQQRKEAAEAVAFAKRLHQAFC